MTGFDDLNRLTADLAGASVKVAQQATTVLAKVASDIEATSKQLAPVDTGALKNSISWEFDTDHSAEIGPTVEYGAHVEFGTVHQAPAAYMGPALDLHGPTFAEAMANLGADVL